MKDKPQGTKGESATGADPLAVLEVLDRLEVGPPKVEPRRVTTPYRVVAGKGERSTELIYSFEEDVFDPSDSESKNLAAMITAQVALNYGLFCREMVFHGLLDPRDRRFIEEYAAHTAREIYVKKFLEPNPFLTGAAVGLPVVKRESYLRARISFEGGELRENPNGQLRTAEAETSRCVVLSSGGKDSLLSFGLLREMGADPQAAFVNESGRHWFTALNAYRHFARHVPGTARVWTNSDRVFSWMLRQFPFVRRDFAAVRSDEYPIRLWTVAVFIFGALPILLKRRIRRLVIGDEFDTTVRRSHRGVTHYGGLFDQGRNFDNAMTRYFQRKRWGVSQFSLLRPLSELLIEKTLGERYPDLQRLQMSCHAAHVEGDTVRPCGRCEKCRRIVGMLLALDMDPAMCGYTESQVRDCVAAIARDKVQQEAPGAEHLAHILVEKGILPQSAPRAAHKEIMMLRFDPEASPFETIPRDLRAPLYRILLQHAQGAVLRQGRTWIPCNPLSEEALSRPYPFEGARARGRRASLGAERQSYRLGELTWPEARERFKQVDIALLPVGSIEQHGPHLPLDTDAHDALRLAEDVAARCSVPQPLVLPAIWYGVSYHHDDFAGTLSIGPETLSKMVYEIGTSLARNGITKMVIVNGHEGNSPALHFAAQMINRDARIFTCVDTGETSDADIEALTETPNDVHAGEIETSTALYLRPHLVKLGKAKPSVPSFSSRYLDFSSKRGVGWYARTKRISRSGVLGDPTRASREKGEKMWSAMVDHLVRLVDHLKGMTLDEIHQRRY